MTTNSDEALTQACTIDETYFARHPERNIYIRRSYASEAFLFPGEMPVGFRGYFIIVKVAPMTFEHHPKVFPRDIDTDKAEEADLWKILRKREAAFLPKL